MRELAAAAARCIADKEKSHDRILVMSVVQFSGPFDCRRPPPTARSRRCRRGFPAHRSRRPSRDRQKLVKITWPEWEEAVAVATGSEPCVARRDRRETLVRSAVRHLETSTRGKIDKKSRGTGGDGLPVTQSGPVWPSPPLPGFGRPLGRYRQVPLWPSSRRRRATCSSNLSGDSRWQRQSIESVRSSRRCYNWTPVSQCTQTPAHFCRIIASAKDVM